MNLQHAKKQEILESIHKIITKNGFKVQKFTSVQELYNYLTAYSTANEANTNVYTNFSNINVRLANQTKLSCLEVFLHSLVHICSINITTKNIVVDSVNLNWILDWILIDYLAYPEGVNRLALGKILKEFYSLLCQNSRSKPNNLILYILEAMQTGKENKLIDINLEIQKLKSTIDPRLKNNNFYLEEAIIKKVENFYKTRYSRLAGVIQIRFTISRV